jgi:hypothetical protein
VGGGRYGAGTGPILLDDVVCGGHEGNIADCRHRDWNTSNCGHTEDVGVICTGRDVYTRTYTHIHACAKLRYACMDAYILAHTHMYGYILTRTHTCAHAHTHTHTRTHTWVHTHSHTHDDDDDDNVDKDTLI